jgi:hypothetical protein
VAFFSAVIFTGILYPSSRIFHTYGSLSKVFFQKSMDSWMLPTARPRKAAAAAVWPLPAVWPGKAPDAADGPENSSGAQIQGLSAEEEKSSTLGSFVCLARIGSETSDFPMRMTPDRSEAFDVGCPDHLTDDYLGNA